MHAGDKPLTVVVEADLAGEQACLDVYVCTSSGEDACLLRDSMSHGDMCGCGAQESPNHVVLYNTLDS